MATEVKIKELSMNDLVLGENKQVHTVSLNSETMREKLCSLFTDNIHRNKRVDKFLKNLSTLLLRWVLSNVWHECSTF